MERRWPMMTTMTDSSDFIARHAAVHAAVSVVVDEHDARWSAAIPPPTAWCRPDDAIAQQHVLDAIHEARKSVASASST